MKNLKELIIAIVVIVVCTLAGVLILSKVTPKNSLVTGEITLYDQNMSNTAVACGNNTSTLLLATSTTGRSLIVISNTGSFPVFLQFGNPPAKTYQGIMIGASTTMNFSGQTQYDGQIYCIGLGGIATTSITSNN